MRFFVIFSVIILFSCKSSKKITEQENFTLSQTEEITDTKETVTITDNLLERITETTITKNETVQDSVGKTRLSPITITRRDIERFNITTQKGNVITNISQSKIAVSDSSSNKIDKQTDGTQTVNNISKGVTEGILKGIFGDFFKYVLGGIIVVILLVILASTKNKKDVSGNKAEGKE
jgi:hypothetical protein